MNEKMFCFQCQETAKGTGCTLRGVCGKEVTTSAMMDMLLFSVRGLCVVTNLLRKNSISVPEKVDIFILDALFTTITNANFDEKTIQRKVEKGFKLRDTMIKEATKNGIKIPGTDETMYSGNPDDYYEKAKSIGVLREEREDIRSLKELILYGLKGMAAYLEHACNLGFKNQECYNFIQRAISDITIKNLDEMQLTMLVLETGSYGFKAMALLDEANTNSFGKPEITHVNIGVQKRPGILVSGHDLKDLEMLLEQTQGTGIDIYTHGEMLPANAYPEFKKYTHLVGNYGNAWWKQREEFEKFNGPILMTTNCIVPPLPNANYINRMFTTNSAGYPGCKHIPADENGHKDFSDLIRMAFVSEPPEQVEKGSITTGFAHDQVTKLGRFILNAIRNGKIRKFVVMGGCDGRMKEREYYTNFAKELPNDVVILTAGCAKYRYNKLNLGMIGNIPRVIDAGQCNDTYSLIMSALWLKQELKLDNVNDLPIVYNIAWYEQKAVIVLLALLSLGIKNIHLGPSLPAFLSPNVRNVLIEKFHLSSITTVNEDIKSLIS